MTRHSPLEAAEELHSVLRDLRMPFWSSGAPSQGLPRNAAGRIPSNTRRHSRAARRLLPAFPI